MLPCIVKYTTYIILVRINKRGLVAFKSKTYFRISRLLKGPLISPLQICSPRIGGWGV